MFIVFTHSLLSSILVYPFILVWREVWLLCGHPRVIDLNAMRTSLIKNVFMPHYIRIFALSFICWHCWWQYFYSQKRWIRKLFAHQRWVRSKTIPASLCATIDALEYTNFINLVGEETPEQERMYTLILCIARREYVVPCVDVLKQINRYQA